MKTTTWLIVVGLLAFVLFTKAGGQLLSGFGFNPSAASATGSVGMRRPAPPPPNPYATQQQAAAWVNVVNQGAGALGSLGGAVKNFIGGGTYGPTAPPASSWSDPSGSGNVDYTIGGGTDYSGSQGYM